MLNLYPLPFSTLPVTIYHVYLHPRDYAAVEAIVPRIVEQVERALTAEIESLNTRLGRPAPGLITRLIGRPLDLAPIEIPPSWEVHILPDPDGELKSGELGIVSTLSIAGDAEYSGTPTTRIVKSHVAGARRTATTSHVPQVVSAPAVAAAPAVAVASGLPSATSVPASEPLADSAERARLTYYDERGGHVFSMRKDSISVGRGGSAAWVDVQVVTTAKVSREHFRIRRDPGGRFFIQDVSSWGTSVDGEPVPPAVKSEEGVLQPGPERELPLRAQIALADALVMQFEAAAR